MSPRQRRLLFLAVRVGEGLLAGMLLASVVMAGLLHAQL